MQTWKVKVRGSDIHDPLGHGVCVCTLSHSRHQCEGTIVVLSVCLSDLSHTSHTQKHSHIQTEKTNSLDFDAQDSTWRINPQSLCKNGKQYHPRNLQPWVEHASISNTGSTVVLGSVYHYKRDPVLPKLAALVTSSVFSLPRPTRVSDTVEVVSRLEPRIDRGRVTELARDQVWTYFAWQQTPIRQGSIISTGSTSQTQFRFPPQ